MHYEKEALQVKILYALHTYFLQMYLWCTSVKMVCGTTKHSMDSMNTSIMIFYAQKLVNGVSWASMNALKQCIIHAYMYCAPSVLKACQQWLSIQLTNISLVFLNIHAATKHYVWNLVLALSRFYHSASYTCRHTCMYSGKVSTGEMQCITELFDKHGHSLHNYTNRQQ